VALCEVYLGII